MLAMTTVPVTLNGTGEANSNEDQHLRIGRSTLIPIRAGNSLLTYLFQGEPFFHDSGSALQSCSQWENQYTGILNRAVGDMRNRELRKHRASSCHAAEIDVSEEYQQNSLTME